MNNITIRTFGIILLAYLLSFGYFFVRAIFSFDATLINVYYHWQWIFSTATIGWIQYLIPVHVSGILISYSLFFNPISLKAGHGVVPTFFKLIRSSLILFIIMSLGFAFLHEGLLPSLVKKESDLLYQSRISKQFLEEGREAYEKQDFYEAARLLRSYLAIFPQNLEIMDLYEEVQNRLQYKAAALGDSTTGEDTPSLVPINMSAAKYVDEAEQFFEQEDYYSAHYYATQALKLDGTRLDAKRIAADSWAFIVEMEPSNAELREHAYYINKRKAYGQFVKGEFVSAYYALQLLNKENPDDLDVRNYYEKTKEALKDHAFYYEEVIRIASLPGVRHVVFKNAETLEFIAIRKLVIVREGYYAFDVEGIKLDAAGNVIYHFKAPYGKVINNYLNMQCIGEEDRSIYQIPVYLTGFADDGSNYTMKLSIEPEILPTVSIYTEHLTTLSLPELYEATEVFEVYGYNVIPVQMEILSRLLHLSGFLTASFIGIGLGWVLRSRYVARPPLLSIPLIPLFPIATNFIFYAIVYFFRMLIGYALVAGGYVPGFLTFVALESMLFIGSLFLLASQVTNS